MAQDTTQDFVKQIEAVWGGPMRNYLGTVIEHAEAITHLQLEAARAYTNIAFSNGRSVLSVRTTNDLQDYVTTQFMVVKQLGERVKKDTAELTAAHQKLLEEAAAAGQQATHGGVTEVQKAAEDGVQRVAAVS